MESFRDDKAEWVQCPAKSPFVFLQRSVCLILKLASLIGIVRSNVSSEAQSGVAADACFWYISPQSRRLDISIA